MRLIRTTFAFALLFATAAASACDGPDALSPGAPAAADARFDAQGSSSCVNVKGTGTMVLDPATGELVGSLAGDLTGTHSGVTLDVIQHGNGATSFISQATFVTNEFGTLILAENLVSAPVSPTLFLANSRATVAPGGQVSGGFLMIHAYLDVSGVPQGTFDYHGQICT